MLDTKADDGLGCVLFVLEGEVLFWELRLHTRGVGDCFTFFCLEGEYCCEGFVLILLAAPGLNEYCPDVPLAAVVVDWVGLVDFFFGGATYE